MRILINFLTFIHLYFSWQFSIINCDKKNRDINSSILNHKSEQVCYFSPIYGPNEDISGEIKRNEQIARRASRQKREETAISDEDQINSRNGSSTASSDSRDELSEQSDRKNYRNNTRRYRQLRRKNCSKKQEEEINSGARSIVDTGSDVNYLTNADTDVRKDRSVDTDVYTSSEAASATNSNFETDSAGVNLSSGSSSSSNANIEISTNIDDIVEAIRAPVKDKVIHFDTNIDISSGSSVINEDSGVGDASGRSDSKSSSQHSRSRYHSGRPHSGESSDERDYEQAKGRYRYRDEMGHCYQNPEHRHSSSSGSRAKSNSRHHGYPRRPHEYNDFYDANSYEDYSDEYEDHSSNYHNKHAASSKKKHGMSFHADATSSSSSHSDYHRGLSTSKNSHTNFDMNKHEFIDHKKNYHMKNPWNNKHLDYLDDRFGICEEICHPELNTQSRLSCPHSTDLITFNDNSPYVCTDCRKRLYYENNNPVCPICGKPDYRLKKRSLNADERIYHFGGIKKLNHTDYDENKNEIGPDLHYLNLDVSCSGPDAFINPECQNLNINLEAQDGNLVSLGYVKASLNYGHDFAVQMQNRGRALAMSGIQPEAHSPSMLHFIDNRVSEKLIKLNEESELTLYGAKVLQESLALDYNLTPNTFKSFLNEHGFHVSGNKICRRRSRQCGNYDKYRSLDGSCNNVQNPQWGQSNTAFNRILPARYSDGVHTVPTSILGGELPNPRVLSVKLFQRGKKSNEQLTLAVMQWGQLLAHDFGRQVSDQTVNGGIECCMESGEGTLPEILQHHSCLPISISPRDKFYSIHGQRCMNFVRSMTVPSEDCTLSSAKLLNGVTSYMDCSFLYGPDKLTCDKLREFKGGRLKIEFRRGYWMLPKNNNESQSMCDAFSSEDFCYTSGDIRTNQNPQLVILQTLLVKEHNRLADGLAAINLHWTDEKLFQEARRILIAEYQHITYNEWLPILLGLDYCKSHGLLVNGNKTSDGYNSRINPTTTLGFTSGAFRYLHTLVDGDIHFYTPKRDAIGSTRLSNHYFRPRIIEEDNNFEYLLRGLTMQPLQASDTNIHRDITEYLFKSRKNFGMDLVALDIQRGRDHGIPGYNEYRKICRLKVAKDFDDLAEDIPKDSLERLQRAYAHVDDIDLIVGAAMEFKIKGSLLGPTNRCIIAEQFYRSRIGDRYFYNHEGNLNSFTAEQLKEIKKTTLAKIICDMGAAVSRIQRQAFESISPENPLAKCEKLDRLSLEPWKD